MTAPEEPVEEERTDAAEGANEERGSRAPRSRAVLVAVLAAVLILLLATAAMVLVPSAGNDSAETAGAPPPAADRGADGGDRLVEQELAPFYIPLPRDADGRMARVSFAVTWDRPSSSRFRDQRIRVRDRLFLRLTELAAQGENMRSMSLTVRAEARKLLEELLHPEELRVVVTGVFIV
jgi:hypothetical protein